MRQELNFWVIGGDMRQVRLAGLLAADGHSVHTFALEQGERAEQVEEEATLRKAALADCVILPLPVEAESGMLNAPPLRRTVQSEPGAGSAPIGAGDLRRPGVPGSGGAGRGAGSGASGLFSAGGIGSSQCGT